MYYLNFPRFSAFLGNNYILGRALDIKLSKGKILVQMTNDETLQIEHQSGSCSGSESFKNPTVYNR